MFINLISFKDKNKTITLKWSRLANTRLAACEKMHSCIGIKIPEDQNKKQ